MNKHVAIIDDEEIFRIFLEMKVSQIGRTCELFSNAEDFFKILEKNPSKFTDIIVDRFIGKDDMVSRNFPSSCEYYNFTGKIILYSNSTEGSEFGQMEKPFDHIINKGSDVSWEDLLV